MSKPISIEAVSIFTGYNFIGTCREFVWIPNDSSTNDQLPSRFIFKGLKCEYDVEALMLRNELYLRSKEEKEYIVYNFQITDITDIENISGIAQGFEMVFEKFPEMKSITEGEEVIISKKTQVTAFKAVSSFVHSVRIGHGIDVKQTQDATTKLVSEVIKAPDAIMNLMTIKSFDDYTFTHNINVSTISLLIGQILGLSDEQLAELGMGAMLHDVGKLKVPLNIINKAGKLTEQEFAEIKLHPQHGYDILCKSKGLSDEIKLVALQHHEKFRGYGYPKGIKEKEITFYSRICAIADVYDALTTDRPYRVAMSAYEAMKILNAGIDNHFDPQIITAFLRKVSLFPAGSLVILNDNSIGLVLSNNPRSVIRPKLKIVLDSKGERVRDRLIINLTEEPSLFIKGPADPSILNVTGSVT